MYQSPHLKFKLHHPVLACHSGKVKGANSGNSVKANSPCGPCKENVLSGCKLHSDVEVKCFKRHDKCEETCSRLLICGKHTCNKICHETTDPTGCGACQEACSIARPADCHHQCDLGCHDVSYFWTILVEFVIERGV